ncbi:glucitol operon DNA-binding transcriptional repressor SrlR [Orbus mooreae]|uniref:glucitol operon DNA-binding transcriptional repressor SrlR n=1 Tax=Orbus mooreae TaxID=3074107 RepID=UPI00370D3EAE
MKVKERQAAILDYLQINGHTTVDVLAQVFNTTGTTVRKDLTLLADNNMVIRTYGGAMLNKEVGDQPVDNKTFINTNKKKKIADEAVKLIHEGDFLIFDAGSTVAQMIPMLAKFKHLTIMTNSLHMVNELVSFDNDQTIVLMGGTFRRKSASFHSSNKLAGASLSNYSFDMLFMGADGVDLVGGVTTFNESYEGSVSMCKAAAKLVLLVDSSKFGRRSPNVICSLKSVDTIITDSELDQKYYHALIKMGINVVLVEV